MLIPFCLGPIDEWWFYGFDGGSQILIGIESPYSSYMLKEPDPIYRHLFEDLNSKMYLTKYVIDTLNEDSYCDFEELMSILKDKQDNFSQEFFLYSTDFIVKQIENYDSFGKDDELKLTRLPVFQTLLKLFNASIIMNDRVKFSNNAMECFDGRKQVTSRVNTKISEQIFSRIFADIMNYTENTRKKTIAKDVQVGQVIAFNLKGQALIGRIVSTNTGLYHVNLLCFGNETLLKETSPKNLLFMSKNCLDIHPDCLIARIDVDFIESFTFETANMNCKGFICYQIFDQPKCSFESMPQEFWSSIICLGCAKPNKLLDFKVGDCILFKSDLNLPTFDYFVCPQKVVDYDEDLYPERYRKTFNDSMKDLYQCEDFQNCLLVGYVNEILSESCLCVNIFYR